MAMNTKTMRLPPRRVLTPSASPNKRKKREEGFERPKPNPNPPSTPTVSTPKLLKPDKLRSGLEPPSSNQLLAGYLAHEFLTRGTLFGQPWDPSRAAESPREPEKKKGRPSQIREAEPPSKRAEPEKYDKYLEVADLLRTNGTHLPGVVNPTQLARFLHL